MVMVFYCTRSKGRHAILGNISRVNRSLSPQQLEATLVDKLWDKIGSYVMDTLYIQSAEDADYHTFKSNTEGQLDIWVSNELPRVATDLAQSTLLSDFDEAIDFEDPDQLYGAMKEKIKATCLERLEWYGCYWCREDRVLLF